MKTKRYDEETKRKVVAEKLNGVPLKEIQTKYGVSESNVYAWVAKSKKKAKKEKVIQAKQNKKSPNPLATMIIFLNHAREAAKEEVKANPERIDDPVYMLAMMALQAGKGKDPMEE